MKTTGPRARLCFMGHLLMENRLGLVVAAALTQATGLAVRAHECIEEAFAWIKTIAGQAKTSFRGTARVGWSFTLAAAAYNLIRLPKLLGALP
jgi:hypothetical protein